MPKVKHGLTIKRMFERPIIIGPELANEIYAILRERSQNLAERIAEKAARGENDDAYRNAAKAAYFEEGRCEIDDGAIDQGDAGAYVQAWVWVPREDIGLPIARDDDK